MAGGHTPIPKLQVLDLGTENLGDRIALYQADGKLVGYMMAANLGGDFLPLSGGTMTGDIEISDSYLNFFFEQNQYMSISGEEGIYFFSNGGMTIQPSSIIGVGYSFYFTEKGITGPDFYNKQNDPNAFAQLGDISTTNETLTPLSLSDLNTQYPTQGYGFEVICSEINIIYKKDSLTTWKQFSTTDVV